MGEPYKGKVAGHALRYGYLAVFADPHRRQWHREHKADIIDTFVARGTDDCGREVHL